MNDTYGKKTLNLELIRIEIEFRLELPKMVRAD